MMMSDSLLPAQAASPPPARSGEAWTDPETPTFWRLLLDPRGRISRRNWWIYGVALMLGLGLLLNALLGIARVRVETAEQLVNVLLLWPVLAVSIKRWHDRDQSGWWALVVLVPVVGWLWALWCNGFLRGTAGANRFGADPLTAEVQ